MARSARGVEAAPLAALAFRDFRLLWFGQIVSTAGSQMRIVAVDYHVYRLAQEGGLIDPALALVQLLDRTFPIDYGHHNTAVFAFKGAVDDQDISIKDAKLNHGVTTRHGKKSRHRMRD